MNEIEKMNYQNDFKILAYQTLLNTPKNFNYINLVLYKIIYELDNLSEKGIHISNVLTLDNAYVYKISYSDYSYFNMTIKTNNEKITNIY